MKLTSIWRAKSATLFSTILLLPLFASAQSITSGNYKLTFPEVGSGAYGIYIAPLSGNSAAVSPSQPIEIYVCTTCSDETTDPSGIGASYSSVSTSGSSVVASATITSPNGSVFQVTETYSAGSGVTFTMARTVTITSANSQDIGFNSHFLIGFASPTTIGNYRFLAPGIWYDKNADIAPGAFASNYSNNYFYWHETRSGLPFIMMQDPSTGTALSIAHINSTPSSGVDETNQSWLVDSSAQYGSIGAQRIPQMELGFIYPAEEGDGNYVGDRSLLWARRSHPVSVGFSHSYTLAINIGQYQLSGGSADYSTALQQTWRTYFNYFNPSVASVPMSTVYSDGISLLNDYSATRGGAQGFPFSANLPDGSVSSSQISYLMGFVGEQIPAAYQMVREGLLNNDPTTLESGIATIDFWAHNASTSSGLPLTWYNVSPATFRDDDCNFPIFMRTVSDGMEGVLNAAMLMREHNQPQIDWENFAVSFGNWLVSTQNADGSFYRAFDPSGAVFTGGSGCDANGYGDSKSDTTHPVRFLVTLYFATGNTAYLNAAIAAGNYAYTNFYQANSYWGGTPDNGNTIDKEAAVEALHAFLALYDATKSSQWLTAASSAADFAETWMYAWNYPITAAPAAFTYAGTQGSSLIATGQSGSDIFLAFEPFDFYRLHLLTNDTSNHYLTVSEYLANNTKLTTQLAGVVGQNFGYRYDGLVGEAEDLSFTAYQAGSSAGSWLPWLTEAEIEPLAKFQDIFGNNTISTIESQPLSQRLSENAAVYPAAGSIDWGDGLGLANPGFELPGISTNSIPGWQVWTPDNGASMNAAFTETYGQSHDGSWHLAEYKPTAYTLSTYQNLKVPNGIYQITAWVECSGGQADTHMEIHDNQSPDVFTKVPACLSSTGYQEIGAVVSVTTGAMTIGFYSQDTSGGHWLRVDDVSVLSNPGFEYPGAVVSPPPGYSVWLGTAGSYSSSAYTENSMPSHSGSWHLTEYQSTPYQLSAYQDVLVSNGPHTVTAWVECSGGQADSHLELHNYTSPDTFTKVNACLSSTSYQQISATVTVTTGKITIGFYTLDNSGGHWLRVDDVSIQ